MPADTAVGALPYPLAADPNDVPADLLALANRIVVTAVGLDAAFTTAERDALAGDDLWAERVILNTTTGELNRYTGGAWVSLGGAADSSYVPTFLA